MRAVELVCFKAAFSLLSRAYLGLVKSRDPSLVNLAELSRYVCGEGPRIKFSG